MENLLLMIVLCAQPGHARVSSERTPSSSSLALTTASQPLLACGLLGDGCRIPSTRTWIPAADKARRACCSATRPTPITMEIPNASTAWHSAASQCSRRDFRSAAGSSGGVKFLPLALMKMSGHRLCTKQCWKKRAGSSHSFLKKPQKRAPLTSLWAQESPIILRFGCSSGGRPTSPVILSQSTTDLTSPKGTCVDTSRSFLHAFTSTTTATVIGAVHQWVELKKLGGLTAKSFHSCSEYISAVSVSLVEAAGYNVGNKDK